MLNSENFNIHTSTENLQSEIYFTFCMKNKIHPLMEVDMQYAEYFATQIVFFCTFTKNFILLILICIS